MSSRDTLITGIGLISAAGEGIAANLACLGDGRQGFPRADGQTFAPHPVFAMVPLDLSQQIPRRGDQRQMGPWQHFGVFAAGLALADAGLVEDNALLERTNLIVAAGGGERDEDADSLILNTVGKADSPDNAMNEALQTELRPTLFLAQLSNLLAGNISIVHHVTGSSRTLMGEELAGAMALQVAHRRIRAGQGDLFLVGGAYNAERRDMQVNQILGGVLWDGAADAGVHARIDAGGGIVPGSMAAFLVLESREHAEKRGARSYARLTATEAESGPRSDEERAHGRIDDLAAGLAEIIGGEDAGYLSCASGEPVSARLEQRLIAHLGDAVASNRRTVGSVIGHGFEAELPAALALAAAALADNSYYPPFDPADPPPRPGATPPSRIVVTSFGHWRGEGVAVVDRPD